ncbi:hypothetical protein DXG01_011937 [Tephrocybe rancida]|nr:hypothetical protein DXG01_011937 [Tephrocybe rancida]
MSSSDTPSSLRDTLLRALTVLPGTREFHLHVLVTAPRKNASLFPFAHPRPRAYLQDILVLCSEQATPDAPRKLVTAIEASVYNVASTSSAIFYIAKVDSTGQGATPSPTYPLVKTLLAFYADPQTRPVKADHFWLHVFARAQSQYLFPNSAEFEGKRPLSDIKLCAWWKRVFTDVEHDVAKSNKAKTKIYYLLPGYGEFEASHALKNASSSSSPSASTSTWIYGHPYSQKEINLPCPPDFSEDSKNLGHFIPSFDDDPKSRFMDEIAYTTEGDIKSPQRKRKRTASSSQEEQFNSTKRSAAKEPKEKESKDDPPLGELRKVNPDEFWERMSFRQECVAGAVTGFFTLGITTPSSSASSDIDLASSGSSSHLAISAPSPLAPQPGQVPAQLNKRVLTTLTTGVEFSTVERAVRGTEIIENGIRGLCEGIAPIPTIIAHAAVVTLPKPREFDRRTPERETSSSSLSLLLAPPRTPPPRCVNGKRIMPEVSPNPFPEPETSLETYRSHIYGSVGVSNPVAATGTDVAAGSGAGGVQGDAQGKQGVTKAAVVTVLMARKKKKRSEQRVDDGVTTTLNKKRSRNDVTRDDDPHQDSLVQIKEEHDQDQPPPPPPRLVIDTTTGAPPPSTIRPTPSKRRRVTISGAPHALNTDVRATPDQTNSTPISPVVMGFTITRDGPTMEKMKAMINVKQKQKALIEQRRGSVAGLTSPTVTTVNPPIPPTPSDSVPTAKPVVASSTRNQRRSPNNTATRRLTQSSQSNNPTPRPPSPSPIIVPSQQPSSSTSTPNPNPMPNQATNAHHSLPPPPISFARRRAEQLGSTRKKPADILISPREAQTQDQFQPAIQSAPPVPHAGQNSVFSGRFPMMALPRLPSVMGGGDNVRRVATAVPPTPTRLAMQRPERPTHPPPPPIVVQQPPVTSTPQRSPPAASVPIASTLVPPTPGLFHHPGYAGDKAAFLAPFEVFYDALNDSKQLKSWLGEQLQRSNAMMQALTQQQEKLNEVVESLVEKQTAPMRAEVAGLHRRVEELEDALRSASASRRHSTDHTAKHAPHKGGRTPLRNGVTGSPMPAEAYTFPPQPQPPILESSLSSRRRTDLRRPSSSPTWGQETPMEVDTGSPKPLSVPAPPRMEASRSLPLEPPTLSQPQRLSPRAPFDSPRPETKKRPSLSRQASSHSISGAGEGAQRVQSPPLRRVESRRGSVVRSPPDAPAGDDS